MVSWLSNCTLFYLSVGIFLCSSKTSLLRCGFEKFNTRHKIPNSF